MLDSSRVGIKTSNASGSSTGATTSAGETSWPNSLTDPPDWLHHLKTISRVIFLLLASRIIITAPLQ